MRVLTTVVIVAVLFLGMLSTASEEGETALQRVLGGVHDYYADIQSMRCSFEQENSYLGGEALVQKGKLELKRPAQMRWDYQEPSQRCFISDGASLWIYEPLEKRAFLMEDLDSSFQSRLFGFVLGLQNIEEEFAVVMLPTVAGVPIGSGWCLLPSRRWPESRRFW